MHITPDTAIDNTVTVNLFELSLIKLDQPF